MTTSGSSGATGADGPGTSEGPTAGLPHALTDDVRSLVQLLLHQGARRQGGADREGAPGRQGGGHARRGRDATTAATGTPPATAG